MRRLAQSVAFRAIHLAGRGRDDGGIAILSYHAIDACGGAIAVSPGLFRAQLASLVAARCRSLTMGEVGEYLAAGRPFPPRAVAITFDDGFASVATVAAPLLAEFGLTATVYVITGMIGRVIDWRAGGRRLPALPLLTWTQVGALASAGIEIGAHTATHRFLTRCAPPELDDELAGARRDLERALGAPVRSFAYPQGDYNEAVVAAVRRAGYTTAVTIDQGRATPAADPYRLPRLHVGENATPVVIRAFASPAVGPLYRAANAALRRWPGHRDWPRPDRRTTDSTASRLPDGAR